jgi:fucose 4-O-acetylase-like acetyltransferase
MILASLVAFSLIGYLVSLFFPLIKLPFGIESAITAIVFLGLGSLYTTNKKIFSNFDLQTFLPKYSSVLLPVFAVICFYFATISFNIYGQQADIRLNHINNYFLFYFGALSGVLFTFTVSLLIHKNFILEYTGKNTLSLFALHPLVFIYIGKLWEALPVIKNITLNPIFYTMLSILIILAINKFYKKTHSYLFLKR